MKGPATNRDSALVGGAWDGHPIFHGRTARAPSAPELPRSQVEGTYSRCHSELAKTHVPYSKASSRGMLTTSPGHGSTCYSRPRKGKADTCMEGSSSYFFILSRAQQGSGQICPVLPMAEQTLSMASWWLLVAGDPCGEQEFFMRFCLFHYHHA